MHRHVIFNSGCESEAETVINHMRRVSWEFRGGYLLIDAVGPTIGLWTKTRREPSLTTQRYFEAFIHGVLLVACDPSHLKPSSDLAFISVKLNAAVSLNCVQLAMRKFGGWAMPVLRSSIENAEASLTKSPRGGKDTDRGDLQLMRIALVARERGFK